MFRLAASLLALSLLPVAGHACGPDSDCMLGDRPYRIDLPQGVEAPGAIIFAHGYRGSHVGTMRNKSMRALADRLGVAFVAIKSFADDWRIPGTPSDMGTDGEQELRYMDMLVTDLGQRHGINTERLMLTGFSAGGMMVWQMACDRAGMFAGFAPIAGTFWDPVPQSCANDGVNLIHIHGMSDKIVPVAGRAIARTRQGDVMQALDMAGRMGAFGAAEPMPAEGLSCEARRNQTGNLLEYCTHPGGHSVKAAYVEHAWKRLEAIGAL